MYARAFVRSFEILASAVEKSLLGHLLREKDKGSWPQRTKVHVPASQFIMQAKPPPAL